MIRTPASLTAELEATFERIRVECMADIPILNDAIRVEAVGFRAHHDHFVGVLVTPWFMNLMLVPADPDASPGVKAGSTSLHAFPAGEFEFIAGYEEGFGHFAMCSLFSPMFEFADHAAAAETAAAVMEGIMTADEEQADTTAAPARPMSRRELFRQLAGGEPG